MNNKTLKSLFDTKIELKGKVVLGFDGFVDRIGKCQKNINTMEHLANCLLEHKENSFTLELENIVERLGGNMPNVAYALSCMGASVRGIGTFGKSNIHQVFVPLSQKSTLVSIGDPGYCLAIEFNSCKLFLSDTGAISKLIWSDIVEKCGLDTLKKIYDEAEIIGLFNWGELVAMQNIWEGLENDIFPLLSDKKRVFVIDPSDITHRSNKEVHTMLETIKRFKKYGNVVMSVNIGETNSLLKVCGIEERSFEDSVSKFFALHYVDSFIVHAENKAIGTDKLGSVTIPTKQIEKPIILTGGGDNFNAGIIAGILLELPLKECLMLGNVASCYFVQNGVPCTLHQLFRELEDCHNLWQLY